MKIIKHEYYSDNITIECKICHCVYEPDFDKRYSMPVIKDGKR